LARGDKIFFQRHSILIDFILTHLVLMLLMFTGPGKGTFTETTTTERDRGEEKSENMRGNNCGCGEGGRGEEGEAGSLVQGDPVMSAIITIVQWDMIVF
jgi:hypothetical protein